MTIDFIEHNTQLTPDQVLRQYGHSRNTIMGKENA
jgi:hypothetical protein